MRTLIIASTLLWGAFAASAANGPEGGTPEGGTPKGGSPNILILYADDLGYGDLGCYSAASKIPTPHLDRLASQGMRFTDAHSSSGICTPSRYALLTGRYHWRKFHGIVQAMGASVFDADRVTLPEFLQQQGYHTGAIGKWHLGWDWKAIRKPDAQGKDHHFSHYDWSQPVPDGPLAHGFDYYFGDTVINFPPYGWIENDRLVQAPDTMKDESTWPAIKEGRWECRNGPMVSGWNPYENIPTTTAKGVSFIREQAAKDEPFFLYFAFPSPHAPIIPNDRFDGKSEAGAYGDFVVETDDAIGQLLAALEATGEADRTLVFFSADNGPEHYAYERDKRYGHWSSEPLRGLKVDRYEGGHRVPTIVRWPGRVTAGSVCDELVSQIDLYATLAAVLDAEIPAGAADDSLNLLPLWTGATDRSPRRTLVHNTFKTTWAIRHEGWNWVDGPHGYHRKRNREWELRHGYPDDPDPKGQLFHLAEDLGQMHTLREQHPEKVAELKARLAEVRARGVR